MRGKVHVTVEGLGDLRAVLAAANRKETGDAMKEVLYAEAQEVLQESKRQVPFRLGVLSASGMVHEPFTVGAKVAVEISYGGAAIDYALEQHENEKFRHAPGRKAKYLEDPVTDASGRLAARMRQRIAVLLRRRGFTEVLGEDWAE
jgi:hypothetical protein